MSPSAFNYVVAIRSKQSAPPPDDTDLVDVIRAAHWRWKRATDAADRWKRVRDRALRDLNRNGQS